MQRTHDMLTLSTTAKFRKDYRRMKKRGADLRLLQKVIDELLAERPLAEKHRNHRLTGDYEGFWECHVQPDWLLVYYIEQDELVLTAARTGSHSDLF